MPKVAIYNCYISRLIYPLSGNTPSKYKVPCHVKHCTILHSDFNDDTSIVLNATFFLVYESQVYTSSFVLQNVHDYFKKKERGGSSHHHILIQSPQVVCAKQGKTKPKHIKSRSRTSKIRRIWTPPPKGQPEDQPTKRQLNCSRQQYNGNIN